MSSRAIRVVFVVSILTVTAVPAAAQWVVHDPTNYVQAVTAYTKAVQQYEFLLQQARRLPQDVAARYRVPTSPWPTHDIGAPHASGLAAGLNTGVGVAARYRAALNGLDVIDDVTGKLPHSLRGRLMSQYGALQLADSAAVIGIEQTGAIRAGSAGVSHAIQALEDDAVGGPDEQHSQTALLNKINGASVLGLRIAERSTQFLASTVEQLLVDNLRKREAEAQLMNAHLYRWRYGQQYGAGIFRETAQKLDTWRQP